VVGLLTLEAVFVTAVGAVLGVVALVVAGSALAPWLQAQHGVALAPWAFTATQAWLLAAIAGAGLLAGLLPGWRAYRLSLADGLSPKV
jgi:putative ABC transport system permease protein